MTLSEIQSLPLALNELSQSLNLSTPLASQETLNRLDAESTFSVVDLKEFSIGRVQQIARLFGPALEDFRVLHDDDTYWRWAEQGADVTSLQTFASESRDTELSLRIAINKAKLLEQLGLTSQSLEHNCFLYLFSERVPYLFSGDLTFCERALWGQSGSEQAIIFLCDAELLLVGNYLILCGGQYLSSGQTLARTVTADEINSPTMSCSKMHRICRDNLHWQNEWVQHLTPLHFHVENRGAVNPSEISRMLALRSAMLFLLYSAEHTRLDHGKFISVYQRGQAPVSVPWPPLSDSAFSQRVSVPIEEAAAHLVSLIRWIYDPSWTTDRLLTAQLYFSTELRHFKEAQTFEALLNNASRLKTDLEARWVSFIEKKLDGYSEQERKFEDDVIKVAQGFDEQIGTMIQTLINNGLATVAAVVTSFLASLYKDPFNPTTFIGGLWIYAFYILIFPISIGQSLQWGRFLASQNEFESRRMRIEKRLGNDKVNEIVDASQFDNNKKRFKRWFTFAAVVYVSLFVLAIVSTLVLPPIFQRRADSGYSTQTSLVREAFPLP